MVFVRLVGAIIHTETVVLLVVVVISAASGPVVVALNTEVVVAVACEFAATGTALKQSLSQSDGCRYVITLHLLDGDILVLVDILLVSRVPLYLRKCRNIHGNGYKKEYFSHIMQIICAKIMISLELFVNLPKNIAIYERTGAKVGY